MPEHDYVVDEGPGKIVGECTTDSDGNEIEQFENRVCGKCGTRTTFFFSGGQWRPVGGETTCRSGVGENSID